MKKIFKSPIFIVILAAVITVVAAFLIKGAVEKAKSEPTPQNVVSWTIDNIENAPSYVASYAIDLETELFYKDEVVKIAVDGVTETLFNKNKNASYVMGTSYVEINDDAVEVKEERYIVDGDKYRLIYNRDDFEDESWSCTKFEGEDARFYDLLDVVKTASKGLANFTMTEETVDEKTVYKLVGTIADASSLIDNLKWNEVFNTINMQPKISAKVEILIDKDTNFVTYVKVDMTDGFKDACKVANLDLDVYSMSMEATYSDFNTEKNVVVPVTVEQGATMTTESFKDWQSTRFVGWFENKANEEEPEEDYEFTDMPEGVNTRLAFTMCGKKLWIGMPVENMLVIAPFNSEYQNSRVAPGETARVYLRMENEDEIGIDVYNATEEMQFVADCVVVGVEFYKLDLMNTEFKLGAGLSFTTTLDSLESKFGKCQGDNIIATTGYITYKWNLADNVFLNVKFSESTNKIVSIYLVDGVVK